MQHKFKIGDKILNRYNPKFKGIIKDIYYTYVINTEDGLTSYIAEMQAELAPSTSSIQYKFEIGDYVTINYNHVENYKVLDKVCVGIEPTYILKIGSSTHQVREKFLKKVVTSPKFKKDNLIRIESNLDTRINGMTGIVNDSHYSKENVWLYDIKLYSGSFVCMREYDIILLAPLFKVGDKVLCKLYSNLGIIEQITVGKDGYILYDIIYPNGTVQMTHITIAEDGLEAYTEPINKSNDHPKEICEITYQFEGEEPLIITVGKFDCISIVEKDKYFLATANDGSSIRIYDPKIVIYKN